MKLYIFKLTEKSFKVNSRCRLGLIYGGHHSMRVWINIRHQTQNIKSPVSRGGPIVLSFMVSFNIPLTNKLHHTELCMPSVIDVRDCLCVKCISRSAPYQLHISKRSSYYLKWYKNYYPPTATFHFPVSSLIIIPLKLMTAILKGRQL